MALILGVKIGDVVDVAERWVAVLSIDTRESATLIGSGGQKITVSSDQMTQVAPDVWIGLGPDAATSRLRLVFDAPRHIPITRRHD
ncbi:MAG: hypothetical protein GEV13_35405 [Rhodospirillales bacterium]|nr:hypothetical protein [Rhodospirillales bacterium]